MATKPPYTRDGFEKTIRTMEVKKLFIKDVRCFEGETEFNIRPLTFLVGENSTGKSTVLGCMQALRSGMKDTVEILKINQNTFDGFNIPPYEMGTFADIARKVKGNDQKFKLGFGLQASNLAFTLSFVFGENSNGVFVAEKEWKFDDGKITMIRSGVLGDFRVSTNSHENHFAVEVNDINFSWIGSNIYHLSLFLEREHNPASKMPETAKNKNSREALKKFLSKKIPPLRKEQNSISLHHSLIYFAPFYSVAPIRSEPKRSYDPITMTETPQGDAIPVLLMKMSRNDKSKWNSLRKQLTAFGKSAGMFDDITVKKFSRSSPNAPFQLYFKARGKQANLADVGYGVSQVLPILVRIFTAGSSTFLMQQPEVHLHPRAQAELLSVLTTNIKASKNRYVLETHSDYMLDRARIEIMNGKIKPEDVSLIYLEPDGNKVAVHNITFDNEANFNHTPEGYREFLNKEAHKLLGF